ncbi:MAG: hypothetical protein Q8914_02145, partial [Bacteroidota bacterium]|nr:hypothetical protein [Bacteroidota bacterium]
IQNRILMKEDDRFFNIGQGLNRYILGYVAEAGFEIRNVRIGLTYESDLTPYSIINEKKSCLELSLGWRFGGLSQYRKK